MASVETKRDDTGRAVQFRVRFRTPEGRSRSSSFPTLKEARAFLATVEHDKGSGRFVDPMAGRQTVASFATEWMAGKVWSPGSRERHESQWRTHVEASIGSMPLASVRRSHLQAVLNRAELGPRSLDALRSLVVAVFRAAERDRLIAATPAYDLEVTMFEGGRVEALEVEQVAALVAAVPARFTALYEVAAATGMRRGEATGLTVPQVNFLRRTIRVDRQVVTPSAGVPYLTTRLKTKASYRTIPVTEGVIEVIARHLEVYGSRADGAVFTTEQGELIRGNRIARMTTAAAAVAGVDATFHSMRHTVASRFLSQGVSVKATADVLGHSPAELLKTYAHFMKTDEDRVREVMANGMSTGCVTAVSSGTL
jgi:integrase